MYKGKLMIGAVVVAVAAAGLANAGPDRRGGHGMGFAADDLPVSVPAMRERQAERFRNADANGDGQLDAGELDAAMQRLRAERRLQRLDADGSGSISLEEFAYPMERRLMLMDRNGDGRIERDELRRGYHDWDDDDDDRRGGGYDRDDG